MTKRKPADHRVNINGTLFRYDDATEPVEIERTLMDVFKGRPGEAGQCMNAQCVIRNKAAFPHPVLGVSVVKTRAYVIDDIDHAVRYTLGQKAQRLIAEHDAEAIGEPGLLTLRVPSKANRKGANKNANPDPAHNTARAKRAKTGKGHPLVRGEKARVKGAVGAL